MGPTRAVFSQDCGGNSCGNRQSLFSLSGFFTLPVAPVRIAPFKSGPGGPEQLRQTAYGSAGPNRLSAADPAWPVRVSIRQAGSFLYPLIAIYR